VDAGILANVIGPDATHIFDLTWPRKFASVPEQIWVENPGTRYVVALRNLTATGVQVAIRNVAAGNETADIHSIVHACGKLA
jgi:hypothetical protein